MVAHRLVEVHGRATRRVEAREPHRAHEHEAQRVVGILEPLVELLLVHPLAVRHDVEAERLHLLDLVLTGRHYERHVGRGEHVEAPCEILPLRIADAVTA